MIPMRHLIVALGSLALLACSNPPDSTSDAQGTDTTPPVDTPAADTGRPDAVDGGGDGASDVADLADAAADAVDGGDAADAADAADASKPAKIPYETLSEYGFFEGKL